MHWLCFTCGDSQGLHYTETRTWRLEAGGGREYGVREDEDGRFGDHFGTTRRYVAWSDAPFRIRVDRCHEDGHGVQRDHRIYESVPVPADVDLGDWSEWATDAAYRDALPPVSREPRATVARRR